MKNTLLKEQPPAVKKDLILREKLALQRTVLANQSTFLAFLRSAMYFLIAGFSIVRLSDSKMAFVFEYILFVISGALFITGIVNYFVNQRKIRQSEVHVGDYKLEYEHKE